MGEIAASVTPDGFQPPRPDAYPSWTEQLQPETALAQPEFAHVDGRSREPCVVERE